MSLDRLLTDRETFFHVCAATCVAQSVPGATQMVSLARSLVIGSPNCPATCARRTGAGAPAVENGPLSALGAEFAQLAPQDWSTLAAAAKPQRAGPYLRRWVHLRRSAAHCTAVKIDSTRSRLMALARLATRQAEASAVEGVLGALRRSADRAGDQFVALDTVRSRFASF